MYAPSFRIWAYETNWGSFAQFAKVQAHQCLPRPQHLTWEQGAAYMLVGATAYRMLYGWAEHALRKDDIVLIWGGAGGLGSMAIQIVKAAGGKAIAVVSEDDKFEYCMNLGAVGCINRKNFNHWGMLPHWKDTVGYNEWLKGARSFGKAIWDILGERKSPRIVFEHPGETTIPTSIFVCDTGGTVVICAGTTGYNATVDLRYLWMRQKRLQGSHFANDEQSKGFNDLVLAGLVDPCMSRVFPWNELPDCHQLMYENKHPFGNMSILVGATEPGLGKTMAEPAGLVTIEPTAEIGSARASTGRRCIRWTSRNRPRRRWSRTAAWCASDALWRHLLRRNDAGGRGGPAYDRVPRPRRRGHRCGRLCGRRGLANRRGAGTPGSCGSTSWLTCQRLTS